MLEVTYISHFAVTVAFVCLDQGDIVHSPHLHFALYRATGRESPDIAANWIQLCCSVV